MLMQKHGLMFKCVSNDKKNAFTLSKCIKWVHEWWYQEFCIDLCLHKSRTLRTATQTQCLYNTIYCKIQPDFWVMKHWKKKEVKVWVLMQCCSCLVSCFLFPSTTQWADCKGKKSLCIQDRIQWRQEASMRDINAILILSQLRLEGCDLCL